ncbi:MAG: hypothetical protein QOJ65_2517 [Fimbriimonadaceae bacterium]|nr:hypothetical protein [Fimbriimonadaceae bacterium]
MSPELRQQILDELARLNDERAEFAPLLSELGNRDPNGIELRALGGMLHSVYTGIEGILKHLLMELDGSIPSSAGWHAELLTQAAQGTENRGPLISDDLLMRLRELMAFRHRYRNTYGFELSWKRMKPLTFTVFDTVTIFERQLNAFFSDLDTV